MNSSWSLYRLFYDTLPLAAEMQILHRWNETIMSWALHSIRHTFSLSVMLLLQISYDLTCLCLQSAVWQLLSFVRLYQIYSNKTVVFALIGEQNVILIVTDLFWVFSEASRSSKKQPLFSPVCGQRELRRLRERVCDATHDLLASLIC